MFVSIGVSLRHRVVIAIYKIGLSAVHMDGRLSGKYSEKTVYDSKTSLYVCTNG